jgi:hypothetical protein
MGLITKPFRIMLLILIVATAGFTGMIAVFISAHPYFSPFQNQELPRGWIDANQYVSANFTIENGSKVTDIFGYSGAGGQSIMVLGIQPLRVDTIGDIDISFNGIPLGQTRIENTLVVNTSIASCCFVTFIQAGVDNVVEITSYGFEGLFRYLIIIPTK